MGLEEWALFSLVIRQGVKSTKGWQAELLGIRILKLFKLRCSECIFSLKALQNLPGFDLLLVFAVFGHMLAQLKYTRMSIFACAGCVLGIEPRALPMLSTLCTTEVQPQPQVHESYTYEHFFL